jgi:enoyl-CoA hydratase
MGQVTLARVEKLAVVRLDRAERRNALDEEMLSALETLLGELEAAPPRAVVVTGAGEAFSIGLDLDPATNPAIMALLRAVQNHDRTELERQVGRIRGLVDRMVGLPVPVIAAVSGPAWGAGAEIALRCDLRALDATATLCLSGARTGLAPMFGGGPALARLVGPARAADLVLTGRKVSAVEAFSLGLANRLSEPGQALESALQLARAIAKNGPRAVRAALRVARASAALPAAEAARLELDAATELLLSGEFLLGMRAAMDRIEPEFPDV